MLKNYKIFRARLTNKHTLGEDLKGLEISIDIYPHTSQHRDPSLPPHQNSPPHIDLPPPLPPDNAEREQNIDAQMEDELISEKDDFHILEKSYVQFLLSLITDHFSSMVTVVATNKEILQQHRMLVDSQQKAVINVMKKRGVESRIVQEVVSNNKKTKKFDCIISSVIYRTWSFNLDHQHNIGQQDLNRSIVWLST